VVIAPWQVEPKKLLNISRKRHRDFVAMAFLLVTVREIRVRNA
jgi:hypothetical protein